MGRSESEAAIFCMIVYQTNRLQISVTDGGTEKLYTAFFKLFADFIGDFAGRLKHFPGLNFVYNRFSFGEKAHQKVVKRTEFLLHSQKNLRRTYGRCYF